MPHTHTNIFSWPRWLIQYIWHNFLYKTAYLILVMGLPFHGKVFKLKRAKPRSFGDSFPLPPSSIHLISSPRPNLCRLGQKEPRCRIRHFSADAVFTLHCTLPSSLYCTLHCTMHSTLQCTLHYTLNCTLQCLIQCTLHCDLSVLINKKVFTVQPLYWSLFVLNCVHCSLWLLSHCSSNIASTLQVTAVTKNFTGASEWCEQRCMALVSSSYVYCTLNTVNCTLYTLHCTL